jgi:hypothetical protein
LAGPQVAATARSAEKVSYTGNSTLPALSNGTIEGVVFAGGTGTAVHGPVELTGQYKVGKSNDTSVTPAPQSWVAGLGNSNDTVMVGAGDGRVANFGTNTQVYMTGQSAESVAPPQTFQEAGLPGATPPSADLWVDGTTSIDGSTGSTTVNLDTTPGVASILGSVTLGAFGNVLHVVNNGDGQNTVNLANSSVSASGEGTVGGITTVNGLKQDVIFLEGSSSVATTVNASGSTATVAAGMFQPELWVVANGGSGVVNGGAQAILAFSSGNGVLSVTP